MRKRRGGLCKALQLLLGKLALAQKRDTDHGAQRARAFVHWNGQGSLRVDCLGAGPHVAAGVTLEVAGSDDLVSLPGQAVFPWAVAAARKAAEGREVRRAIAYFDGSPLTTSLTARSEGSEA